MAHSLPPSIDVHSHFLPPFYRDALSRTGHSKPDGMPAIPPWTPEAHLEMMASCNINKCILSISSPGTHLTPGDVSAQIDLTRACNAYAAGLQRQHPDKIGFWASLPLLNVRASLEEIDRAVAEGCHGFALMTNYHGRYVGDSAFDPVFARLNGLGAIVFLHPTTPCIAHGTTPSGTVTKALPFGSEYPAPIFEFLFDTARAVINMFYSGTVDRCPNVKFIIPHLGGTLPPLITRFTTFGSLVPGVTLDPEQVRSQLMQQFWFDMAGTVFDGESGGRGQLKALVHGSEISYQRLLFGTDFPFTNQATVLKFANRVRNGLDHLFDAKEREAIYTKNAEELLEKGKTREPKLNEGRGGC